VLDAWFDSGSMPFAQWGYPHTPGSREALERAFPADFISEAIDQTRGWFYSLLAVSTLLFDQTSYRNVVCLGHIVDRDGRKMSKSLGNVLDPFELLDRYGADPLRWFMLAGGSPWVSRRLSPEAVEDITRSFFLTLVEHLQLLLPVRAAGGLRPHPGPGRGGDLGPGPLGAGRAGRHRRPGDPEPGRLRRHQRRPAAGQPSSTTCPTGTCGCRGGASGAAPARTPTPPSGPCGPACAPVTLLLAPYAPFTAEELWQGLVVSVDPEAPDSVHLVDWPEPDRAAADPRLSAAMAEVRRLVGLGRQARTEARSRSASPWPGP
jgi:isoleucyl-tRNA synthetase